MLSRGLVVKSSAVVGYCNTSFPTLHLLQEGSGDKRKCCSLLTLLYGVLLKCSCLPDARKLRHLISFLSAYLQLMLMAAKYEDRKGATVNRLSTTAHPFQINLVVSRRKAEKPSHRIALILQHETWKFILDWLQSHCGHHVLNRVNP